jgi:hypothetical protein
MPTLSELENEEGIGYFRDVWTIVDVEPEDARYVIAREKDLVQAIDSLAATAEDFERLAAAVECWDPDEIDVETSAREFEVLNSIVGQEDSADVGGLELGVAGLVHALAATGIVPAASCRGHRGVRPWSESPVVLFATDECRAQLLEPLAREAHCIFDIDEDRPELLVVAAASVRNLMSLAELVVDAAGTFRHQCDKGRRISITGGAKEEIEG